MILVQYNEYCTNTLYATSYTLTKYQHKNGIGLGGPAFIVTNTM